MRVRGGYETELDNSISRGPIIVKMQVNEAVTQARFGGTPNRFDSDPVNLPITIPSTAESNKQGLYPRGLYIKWLDEPPPGYEKDTVLFLPVFVRFRYVSRFLIGTSGTYLDTDAIIIGKRPETIRS